MVIGALILLKTMLLEISRKKIFLVSYDLLGQWASSLNNHVSDDEII